MAVAGFCKLIDMQIRNTKIKRIKIPKSVITKENQIKSLKI